MCGKNEATGIIFELCLECFEVFERRIDALPGEKYPLSDKEAEFINSPFFDRDHN